MRRETTNQAYGIAAALLEYEAKQGLLRKVILGMPAEQPLSSQEIAEIEKAYTKLIASLKRQSR